MKRFLLFLIRFYRREMSPRKRRPACRYIPTCSEYAVTAIERCNRAVRRLEGRTPGGMAAAALQPLQQGGLRSRTG